MDAIKQSQKALNRAVEVLKNGGVVIFPTDTVYGFLALADNGKAIEKIYKIKKRPRSKPLAVFVKDIKMAKTLAEISEKQEKILKKRWPGKFTFILECHSRESGNPVIKDGKIALRIPKRKFLNDLLKKINKPLAQTSVNISGQPALTKISDIINLFKNRSTSEVEQFLIIDAGNLPKSKPSAIIDLTSEALKRLR
ncbi:MAG: threonylcarbamoyl-AMP synthase [Candidatus Staskawiczbacteria bacterium RIFOXYD2_FULL_37_9]|uniref:L-threonylcarbamoyladenylate synthase n=1 Tax=Candidatus Staskawiczbacteria bacterium RIFOXYB1_FULL_37_44 TaxID=1802223 RepID=A0A1G2IVW1_9BACT|nr:MAG: threonylcarbamoyl-AMP synthase [Candidatus Staskawiczbacteria bacterium RIFOXYB1_FULL_37_44]OGZ83985.1 MAG: threonylcarbamoyl-AMP synthase [Candidatus Staskawiczbacteria bacterium RIFOXYC1_FULL_37_52]OGZ89692.1 MAG: threonylcarbamoyl-AMP synthase [Candidatus Staskawiczbacteria bacterium RIFOXYC2_FULL_37_19]OGZ92926.1 MAG: threonylcarbamoyl-AMP synthase [Candidatus Staskawiczbacteria bacterium RIFOXYD2_FULL_37_9]